MTVTAPQVWTLRCFGGLRVERNSQVITRFRTQKTAAFLALLALNGKQNRERACALLWPDTAPEAARNSLSVALSSLRRELGEEILKADRQNISLAPGQVETDVEAFDNALRRGDYAQAVELYSGHLLPGFHEDPFPALTREYEEKARFAFSSRLDELEESADSLAVLSVARRASTLFGDDERWVLAIMRAYQARDEFDAALRTYENWGRSVRKNGEMTSETVRSLAKSIRSEREARASVAVSAPLAKPLSPEEPLTQELPIATLPETSSLHNFPSQWTQFFGREAERDMLRAWLLGGVALITLSGPGGSGKTRLAIETVREISPEWGGATFVPLAALTDADLLHASIRDALGLAPTPDATPLQEIERALAGKRVILLLDNFEQLLEKGVSLLQQLRERLPLATFVTTSRVLLNLPGEREFPVAPLPTPLKNTALDAVRQCASAALFCDRASIILDADNAEIVSALCRRLDGIPLALELAAARSRMLSPAQILERVGGHPNFLQSREVGLPARHKTLRAAISWSVDLLSPELRGLFTKLSLFRNGWSLQAAEDVCDEPDALDALTQLRESSLIVVEKEGAQPRFRMLETLREFGAEELQGEERAQTEHRFFDYFLRLAKQAAKELQGPEQKEWLERLDVEQDNFRVALAWAKQHDTRRGLELATTLLDYWETRMRQEEGRNWLETFLQTAPTDGTKEALVTRARALSGMGRLAWYSSDISMVDTFLEQGLEAARRANDVPTLIYAIRSLSRVTSVIGGYERACTLGHEGIELSRALGDKGLLLESLIDSAFADMNVARFESAARSCEEAIMLARQEGDEHALALSLLTLAIVLMYGDRIEEVLPLATECEAISRSMNSLWELIACLFLRTVVLSKQGDYESARRSCEDALRLFSFQSVRSWNGFNNLWAVVILFTYRGDVKEATYLLGAIESLRASIRYTILPFMLPEFEEINASLRKQLGVREFEALWNRGHQLTPEQAVEFALNPSLPIPENIPPETGNSQP